MFAYKEKEMHNAEILAVAGRIQVVEDPKFTEAYPERYSTELTLTLKSGEQVTGFCDCPRRMWRQQNIRKIRGDSSLKLKESFAF